LQALGQPVQRASSVLPLLGSKPTIAILIELLDESLAQHPRPLALVLYARSRVIIGVHRARLSMCDTDRQQHGEDGGELHAVRTPRPPKG